MNREIIKKTELTIKWQIKRYILDGASSISCASNEHCDTGTQRP